MDGVTEFLKSKKAIEPEFDNLIIKHKDGRETNLKDLLTEWGEKAYASGYRQGFKFGSKRL